MQRIVTLTLCALLCVACSKKDDAAPAAGATPEVAAATRAPDVAAAPAVDAGPLRADVVAAAEPAVPTDVAAAEPEAPALPVAPDGTQAVACAETAPEGMSCIPGGTFIRGSDEDAHTCKQRPWSKRRKQPNARPQAEVWMQTYYMDQHEVTYAEFKACIKAKRCDVRPEDGKWGPTYRDFSRDRQPITNVNWFQARQYCQWKGKHLPTEAEWEKAARGPSGELYPWGDEPATCERALIKDERGRSCGTLKKGNPPEAGRVFEVGSRPAGRYGLYDMVGNVEEWVADWYTHDWEACGEDCLGVNPRGPCDGADDCKGHSYKVVRGGSWYWEAEHNTGIHRRPHIPENPVPKNYHHFGFRCAASPEEAAAMLSDAE